MGNIQNLIYNVGQFLITLEMYLLCNFESIWSNMAMNHLLLMKNLGLYFTLMIMRIDLIVG